MTTGSRSDRSTGRRPGADIPETCRGLGTGRCEIFDDGRRLADQLEAADIDATLEIESDLPHVLRSVFDFVAGADSDLDELADELRTSVTRRSRHEAAGEAGSAREV